MRSWMQVGPIALAVTACHVAGTTAGVDACQGLSGPDKVDCLSAQLEGALQLIGSLREDVDSLQAELATVQARVLTDEDLEGLAIVDEVAALEADVDTLLADHLVASDLEGYATESWVGDQGFLLLEIDPLFSASNAGSIDPTKIALWDEAYGWGNHGDRGYLTAETDPVYTTSLASQITGSRLGNWDSAYGWGDHSLVGYLRTESDPTFTSSAAVAVTSTRLGEWDTAYAWGNHSDRGYLTVESDPSFQSSAAATLSFGDLTALDAARTFVEDFALYTSVDPTTDAITFSGANVRVQSGAGYTEAAVNGLGNLILGYDESNGDTKSGSHNLVVGAEHSYTSYGALLAGFDNASTGPYASCLGGSGHDASGEGSVVLTGTSNSVSGDAAVVLGGTSNTNSTADTIVP